MDLKKLEEANRIKGLIEGAERSVERGKALFNAKELCIMDKKEGGHTYINGAEKDAIEKSSDGQTRSLAKEMARCFRCTVNHPTIMRFRKRCHFHVTFGV